MGLLRFADTMLFGRSHRFGHLYGAGFQAAAEPMVVLDRNRTVMTANRAWEELVKRHGQVVHHLAAGTHRVIADGESSSETWFEVVDHVSNDGYVVRIVRDITESRRGARHARRAEMQLRLQTDVNQALNAARTSREAIERLLPAVGGAVGWSVGVYWMVDPVEDALRCQAFWLQDGVT